eukprot:NODE_581_length_6441_cov_0.484390.p4 type:complete len:253 gc:universal NODE_581_length_6441_cov_0.484390:5853-5095(-)
MTSLADLNSLAKKSICQIYLYSEMIDEVVENEFIPLSVHSNAGYTLFNEFDLATVPAIILYGLKNTSDATVLGVHYVDKLSYKPDPTKCSELLQACRAQSNSVYQQMQLNNERIQVLQEQEDRLQESMQKDAQRQMEKQQFASWFDDRKQLRMGYTDSGGSGVKLKFRVFNGSTYEKEFSRSDLVKDLYNFIHHFDIFNEDLMSDDEKTNFYDLHKDHGHAFIISSMFPKKELVDMDMKLNDVQGMLIVEEV